MSDSAVLMLSLIVFLPALGALVVAFLPKDQPDVTRFVTLGFTIAVLLLTLWAFFAPDSKTQFDAAVGTMQSTFNVAWIPSFNINYFMGVDGISFPLILLTAFVSVLAMGASWSITKHVKPYCILFLLLETGMLGVFLALDFFLFYVFWEVMLLPMYFLIGVWGGPRREYAAIKFFLYTLFGSVLMLIALLMLYFSSDLRTLAQTEVAAQGHASSFDWDAMNLPDSIETRIGRATYGEEDSKLVLLREKLAADRELNINFVGAAEGSEARAEFDADANEVIVSLPESASTAADAVAAINGNPLLSQVITARVASGSEGSGKVSGSVAIPSFETQAAHTFNLLALAAMGQHTTLFDGKVLGQSIQWWAFILLFIGFAIKVPSVPVHTWLPDAHVEAPTPISMILAGVLLKMGGYGIIRICYPICPHGGYDLAYLVCLIGVVSMIYGAFAALAQTDFKRMVAYSSVSHMGYVVLGLGVWSANAGLVYDPYYWNMGVKGAMFQMIGHGISSAGMFFIVGVVYDRVHHRNLNEFGGLFGKMPVYTALAIIIFFAGLGLPGLCGFIGEAFVVLSVWAYSRLLAVLAAAVVILTAAYILWAIQRVFLGAEYRGPHEEALTPTNWRENLIAGTLAVFAIIFGVFPHQVMLKYMDATIDRQVNHLASWTKYVKEPGLYERVEQDEKVADASDLVPVETQLVSETADWERATD